MNAWEIALLVLWVLVVGLSLLTIALLRHVGMLEMRLQELSRQRVSRVERTGLPSGSRVPALTLLDERGSEVTFVPHPNRRTLVALSQPGCSPCDQLLAELGHLVSNPGAPPVTVITKWSIS